jgi:hypothetical protein
LVGGERKGKIVVERERERERDLSGDVPHKNMV